MQVVAIQHVSFSIAGGSASGTATLSGEGDVDQMVCFASWSTPDVASSEEDRLLVDFDVTDVDTLTATRNASPAGEAVTIEAYVIEFGADTNVYKGTFSMAGGDDTDQQTTTANINGGSPMALNDLTKAFVWCYYRGASAGGAYDQMPRNCFLQCRFDSTSVLGWERRRNVAAITAGHWFVVESSTLSVQHTTTYVASSSNPTETDTITSVTPSESFVLGSYWTQGANDANDEGCWSIDLQDATTVRFRRQGGFQDEHEWYTQVISDPALAVQRGTLTGFGTTDSATLSPSVDTSFTIPITAGSGLPFMVSGIDYNPGNAHKFMDEMWISTSTQIDSSCTEGGNDKVLTWQTVQFPEYVPEAVTRRVMVVS